MSKTSIKITEETVSTTALSIGGGDIATVINAARGSTTKVFTLTRVADLKRIYGDSSALDFQYCKYLLGRGNVLKVVRAPLKNTFVAASVLFPYGGAGDVGLKVTALGAGAGGNDLRVVVNDEGGTGADNLFSLEVFQKNANNSYESIELFGVVSLNPNSEYYYGKVVKSDCITLSDQLAEGVVWTNQTLFGTGVATVTKDLSGGTGTATAEDLADGAYATALTLLENLEIDFATLILPTLSPANAASAATTLITKRKNFVLIVDPVAGEAYSSLTISVSDELKSYVAGYYPRGVMASFPYTVAPSVAIADLIAKLHEKKTIFKSPAGLENGLLPMFIDLEKELTATEIATIQEAGLNPLVIKSGVGVVVWNDATEAKTPLDIQSLATRLLTNYFKRAVYAKSQRFIFADHNEFTWNQWKNEVEPLFRDVKNVNGINDYEVICDRSIMSDEDINNGIMRGVCRFWPIRHVRQIEVKFAIDQSGVTFE